MADQQTQTPVIDKPEANSESSKAHGAAESTTEHQAEAESSALASTKKCAHCSTPEYDPEKKPFKPCPKCQTVRYCSRDCQKSGWKQHKKTCASAAQIYAQTADLKPASAPRVPKKDAHRGGLQKWQFDT